MCGLLLLILHILPINLDSYNLVFKLFLDCFSWTVLVCVCVCVCVCVSARTRASSPGHAPSAEHEGFTQWHPDSAANSFKHPFQVFLDVVFGTVRNSKLSSWSVRSVNPPAGSCSEHTCSAWARSYHGAEIRRWNRWVDLISFHICCGQWCLPIIVVACFSSCHLGCCMLESIDMQQVHSFWREMYN